MADLQQRGPARVRAQPPTLAIFLTDAEAAIRRHYVGEASPLDETLERYGDFFALFEDFRGYVDFFLLQDLVTDDHSAVRFFMPFDNFNPPSVPKDVDAYRAYRRLSIEFVEARNARVDQLGTQPRAAET